MNTDKISRRDLLKTGVKYAALVPASTLLVTKSARAGGSTFVFSDGGVANSSLDCFSAPNQEEAAACVNFFGTGF